MSNSNLISYTKLSPNCNKPRTKAIKKITIHHMAGNLSVERCGALFAPLSRGASSNYGIGSDGRIGMYVEEKNRPWTSSSPANDQQAVTIEVANDRGAPNWHISDKALAALIDLCTDICRRNGIKKLNYTGTSSGNLTMHSFFTDTECPGPYLKSKFSYIAAEVNKRLADSTTAATASTGGTFTPYIVKVTANALNVRAGAGAGYKVNAIVHKGEAYTIVAEQNGWGKLKSGAGWFNLAYTTKYS